MKRQNKVRKCQGEIVSVSEIFEKKTAAIKNYGIVLKYSTRRDVVNMYKEYRSTTLCGAVAAMYQEMAGRHSARGDSIHIIKTVVQPNESVLREQTKQFLRCDLKFPKFTIQKRAPTAAHAAGFARASRPILV
jgi:large subunit ribosomal protein L18Ae